MAPFLILVASAAVAWLSYRKEQANRKMIAVPIALRAIATAMLGILILDGSCPAKSGSTRPIVLVDASLSMGQSPEHWRAAQDSATRLGDLRYLGELSPDSAPIGGYSRIAATTIAAAASGRPVWLVTDGEVSDAGELPPDLVQSLGVVLVPRTRAPDFAITDVRGPNRVAQDDSLSLRVEVEGPDSVTQKVTIAVMEDTNTWASRTIDLENGYAQSQVTVTIPKGVKPGDHVLAIALKGVADAEPRTDRRLHAVTVLPTPGIIVLADQPDWESKFLVRTISDVAGVPVRAFLSVRVGAWQRFGDLAEVTTEQVNRAARSADLLVRFGAEGGPPSRNRAVWNWPSSDLGAGDWYVSAELAPIGTPFAGLTLDSIPPLQALKNGSFRPGDWVALNGQLNRRGAPKPLVFGREIPSGQRLVTMGATGFWRWAFRGGQHGEAYRSLVSSITAWLLGANDSTRAPARPVDRIAARGRPIVFERADPSIAELPIELASGSQKVQDTLRFDGAGRAELLMAPGLYRYRLDRSEGVLGVEEYSDEYLARPISLQARQPVGSAGLRSQSIRDSYPLFILIIAALAGEWWWRRRTGLR